MRDIETIDSELRLVAALRLAARERGGPLPSIDVADTLLDERHELTEWVFWFPSAGGTRAVVFVEQQVNAGCIDGNNPTYMPESIGHAAKEPRWTS